MSNRVMDVTNAHHPPQNTCQCCGWNKIKKLVKVHMILTGRSVSLEKNENKNKTQKNPNQTKPHTPTHTPTHKKPHTFLVSFMYLLYWFLWNILLYGLLQQFWPFILNSFWKKCLDTSWFLNNQMLFILFVHIEQNPIYLYPFDLKLTPLNLGYVPLVWIAYTITPSIIWSPVYPNVLMFQKYFE